MFRGHLFRGKNFSIESGREGREKSSDIPAPFLRMSGSHKFDRSLAHPVRPVSLCQRNVGHNKGSLDFKKACTLLTNFRSGPFKA